MAEFTEEMQPKPGVNGVVRKDDEPIALTLVCPKCGETIKTQKIIHLPKKRIIHLPEE